MYEKCFFCGKRIAILYEANENIPTEKFAKKYVGVVFHNKIEQKDYVICMQCLKEEVAVEKFFPYYNYKEFKRKVREFLEHLLNVTKGGLLTVKLRYFAKYLNIPTSPVLGSMFKRAIREIIMEDNRLSLFEEKIEDGNIHKYILRVMR